MFQLTFAIITPALICGSIADRMKYWPMMLFIALWDLAVYCPIAHCNFYKYGLMARFGTLDFAGGNVVHISSGTAGLVAALILGNRKGWKPRDYDSHPPHNILLTYMGMSMLWVGWYGFNAGSAVAANDLAGNAMLGTQIATSTAALSWMLTECCFRKKPSVLGMVNGAIAGLVAITPACGYVDMTGAFFTGLFGGFFCYFGAQLKHRVFKIDDALDAFGVHAIGGIVGGVCVGFFASEQVTGSYEVQGVYYSSRWVGLNQLAKQVAGICFALTWSAIGSFIILKGIDVTIGLRVSEEEEDSGLDSSLHGETIINPGGGGMVKLQDESTKAPVHVNYVSGENQEI
jgi:Amt family ammonium transporter